MDTEDLHGGVLGSAAEELTGRCVAEVWVPDVPDLADRTEVGGESALLPEEFRLLLGGGQPGDELVRLLGVLGSCGDRQVRAAPVAALATGEGRDIPGGLALRAGLS